MIARHPCIVLFDFAEALNPIVVLAAADAQPGHEASTGSVLSDQERANSTSWSRVSSGTQHLFSIPHLFFSSISASIDSAMTFILPSELGFESDLTMVSGEIGSARHNQSLKAMSYFRSGGCQGGGNATNPVLKRAKMIACGSKYYRCFVLVNSRRRLSISVARRLREVADVKTAKCYAQFD